MLLIAEEEELLIAAGCVSRKCVGVCVVTIQCS